MTAAMASTQLARELCSVAAITHVIHRREISAVELTQVSLDRAERDAKELGSFTIVLHERALAQAQRVDARVAVGAVLPLAGVPVSVKDAIWLAGVPATNGSKAFESFVPTESSASICRLEQAGAVVVGKTNNPEFCLFGYTDGPLLGPARNPYDRERTAGGSSGGAAASVASRATPVALGSDGGGSIPWPRVVLRDGRAETELRPSPQPAGAADLADSQRRWPDRPLGRGRGRVAGGARRTRSAR